MGWCVASRQSVLTPLVQKKVAGHDEHWFWPGVLVKLPSAQMDLIPLVQK
jgi:hypothetical protein